MCQGKRVRVQPKTVVRVSHHCGFAGNFANDNSRLVAGPICEGDVQIAGLLRLSQRRRGQQRFDLNGGAVGNFRSKDYAVTY